MFAPIVLALGVVTGTAATFFGLPDYWSLSPIGLALGMVALSWLGVTRGWLIPGRTHLRELQQERTRGDEWKETALSKDAVNSELLRQNGILIASGRTLTAQSPVDGAPHAQP